LMRILVGLSLGVVIAVSSVLWFQGNDLLLLWTKGKISTDLLLLRVMLLQIVVQTLWMATSNIPAATNKHNRLAYCYLASNVLAVLLALGFIRRHGLWVIPGSFLIAESLICVPFVIRDACRIAGLSFYQFLFRTVIAMLLVSIVVGASVSVVNLMDIQVQSLRFLAALFAGLGAAGVTSWYAFLRRPDRRLLKKEVGRMLGVRSPLLVADYE
jgi:O-antigen/teichoic acid export membrane protein